METPAEPTYYATTDFSGVGFALLLEDAKRVHRDAVEINPKYVDPEVREQGRAWLAEQSDCAEPQEGDPCPTCGEPMEWDAAERMVFCENDWKHL